jgi:hypothetical protein
MIVGVEVHGSRHAKLQPVEENNQDRKTNTTSQTKQQQSSFEETILTKALSAS